MAHKTNTVVFLVGLGAPIALYSALIQQIQERIPYDVFHAIEWWSQDDFGKSELTRYLHNTNAVLIGHSAGGSVAMQALVDFPDAVRRVVMLDSHTLKGMKPLPTLAHFLEIILRPDRPEIIRQVRHAYAPLLRDSTVFDRALEFLSHWVQNDRATACTTIKAMPAHTVLHMGFTDSQYQVLTAAGEKELTVFWGEYHFDTQFLPMSHFDLIAPSYAALIGTQISRWLFG